jgi:hypothetical protein
MVVCSRFVNVLLNTKEMLFLSLREIALKHASICNKTGPLLSFMFIVLNKIYF